MAHLTREIIVSFEEAGQRLDVFCVSHIVGYSRTAVQRAIKEGRITVNKQTVKPKYVVQKADAVAVDLSSGEEMADITSEQQEEIHIPILYEDEHVVVINKPAGLTVHPGPAFAPPAGGGSGGHRKVTDFTVADWFIKRYPAASNVGEDPKRPGIVHRLDKDTSGVMILAKTQPAFEHLKEQFKKHRARKEYLALVFGTPGEPKGRITRPLARSKRNPLRRTVDPEGKPAITEWQLEEKLQDRYALVRVYPLTGRTHQIRVHLHFLGFPIVGDQLYTFKRQRPPQGAKRHLLHAEKLTLMLRNGKRKTFAAPLPEDFENVLESLR